LVLRNISNASLTFEELLKVFLDVKAILNPKPIALGHLLSGTELTSAPEALLYNNSDPPGKEMRYLDRWQRVTYLKSTGIGIALTIFKIAVSGSKRNAIWR